MPERLSVRAVSDVRNALLAAFRRGSLDVPAAAWDLTLGQLRLLRAIQMRQRVTMTDVAVMFDTAPAAASGFVERIERRGFVERAHSATDRRIVEVHLTAAGDALLDELIGIRTEVIERVLASFTPEELAEFDRLVRRLVQTSAQEQQ